MNYATSDPALVPLIERYVASEDREHLMPLVERLGEDLDARIADLGDQADKNPPVLHQYDRDGNRVDHIEQHESYRELQRIAYEQYGLSALSHRGLHGWEAAPPQLVKYILSYLFVQGEFGLACPVSMTDTAARTLKRFGDPDVFGEYVRGLTSTHPETRLTGAMFMTEIQGGTDIARTETQAVPDGEGWRLSGQKWFTSNADADVVMTLARFPGGQENSTRGVGLFMMPRVLPDGTRNTYFINRLKDKFGTRSMPSGEMTLDGAWALQVGELDRGWLQMAEMVNTSRLSNAMRAVALMRRAVKEAAEFIREREIFGRMLIDQPLMRRQIVPLQIDTEAGLGLIFYCGDQLQKGDDGDDQAKSLIRVLTPIAKHYLCKRARHVTGEAMEIRGGSGYIEDFPYTRLVRDSHLGSIWEGSSNVIALDVLRCLRKFRSHYTLADAMRAKLAAAEGTDAVPGAQTLAGVWDELVRRGDAILEVADDEAQSRMRDYADDLAVTIQSTLLFEEAVAEMSGSGRHRKLLVANTYLQTVVRGRTDALSVSLGWVNEILDGTDVDRDAALDVLKRDIAQSPEPAGV
ncbi:acyl-CoA dehydrogenase family protein [Micrococcus luteus]|nr:acyl-CoA dehydrogenase family protein [Micrococcus luteus]